MARPPRSAGWPPSRSRRCASLIGAPPEEVAGDVDLRALLASYASSSVTVSTPATPVVLAATRARAVAAAVGAALANVAAHAGEARARGCCWSTRGGVVVSVRDDGRGFEPARLAEARAEGRLGVASSIEGRVRELGGTMAVESAPGAGTEVELRVPVTG